MLNLEVVTKLSQEEVAKRALTYFGEKGQGLNVTDKEQDRICLEGAGGYVTINLCAEGDTTRVTLVTQEWEYQVKEFASTLS